jgi:hypothetical protein
MRLASAGSQMALTESSQSALERVKERLRQERDTFDQHKTHENRWFTLRLAMGYSSVVLLTAVIIISSLVLVHNSAFSPTVVSTVAAALFVDTLGLIISIWKVVFNPNFMTKLAPITQLEKSEESFFETPLLPSTERDIIILSAKYGVDNRWMDVAPLLRAKVIDKKLRATVSNDEFGGDPARGLRKQLDVTYSYGGRTYSTSAKEDEVLILPETE